MSKGTFVISLDFELFWGMSDKLTLDEYRENIEGGRRAIPKMLTLFERYGIHATWATVGMLAFESKEALLTALPHKKPNYPDPHLSAYTYLERTTLGENEAVDQYHFGPSLIRQIVATKDQELASHTFSHYYCAEEGQDAETFKEDLAASISALTPYASPIESLVFPRNQWQKAYAAICTELGIRAHRGNQPHMLYAPRPEKEQTNPVLRALRLIDAYIPLSGHHVYGRDEISGTPVDVPASAFLRPYSPKLGFLEGLRRARITSSMTKAAREGKLYHLWWHPHNFGKNTQKNLETLEHILQHFASLREKYGMQSMSMAEVARATAP